MKWFKHLSDASDDAFIENLEEIFGWEGYGRWWKLLEIIAKKMDETNACFAEHSWVKWQSFLKGKRNKLELFLGHCHDKGKINLEQNGNILKISCPKLLELRDNHTKNLQVDNKGNSKPLATKNKSKDIEIDKELSKELKRINSLESSTHTDFKNLELSEEGVKFAEENGIVGEHLLKTWQKFKNTKDRTPINEWLKYWKNWILDERKPITPINAEKALVGDELLAQQLGTVIWLRERGMFVNAQQARDFNDFCKKTGIKVTWRNVREWREQGAIKLLGDL